MKIDKEQCEKEQKYKKKTKQQTKTKYKTYESRGTHSPDVLAIFYFYLKNKIWFDFN